MRIAHVAPVIYPVPPVTYGGTERVIADLALAQRALGHSVTVLATRDSTLADIEIVGDFHSVSWHSARSRDVLPPGFPAQLEAQQLRQLATRLDGFDIVHLHGSAHASGLCAASDVRTFRTVHWRVDEADHVQHFHAFPYERIVAISHSQARDIPSANLAGVVHHGLPRDRFVQVAAKRSYLAFIGRMTDQKRPDRAIRLGMASGIPLRLAGPTDPGNPSYFDRKVRPALGEMIAYEGSLTDAQKQGFLSSAIALVFPIDWPEPFGLVMIEAMATGTPVIAWNRGSVSEIVEDGVTGIIVRSIDEALARLDEVKNLDPMRIRRRFEARFSSQRMAREIVELYERELAQRSSSE